VLDCIEFYAIWDLAYVIIIGKIYNNHSDILFIHNVPKNILLLYTDM
jgi:hypothetical protein